MNLATRFSFWPQKETNISAASKVNNKVLDLSGGLISQRQHLPLRTWRVLIYSFYLAAILTNLFKCHIFSDL